MREVEDVHLFNSTITQWTAWEGSIHAYNVWVEHGMLGAVFTQTQVQTGLQDHIVNFVKANNTVKSSRVLKPFNSVEKIHLQPE